jgi:hypothetical protein
MGVMRSSKTLITVYKTTRRQPPLPPKKNTINISLQYEPRTSH